MTQRRAETLLTINAGSTSLRLDLFGCAGGELRRLASEHYRDRAGVAVSALDEFLASAAQPDLVVHRVVHGGSRLHSACLIDERVEAQIRELAALAPLHNPAALHWLQACRDRLGGDLPQVAVFDTGFYAELPAVAAAYALPSRLSERHGIRRYGFHGIAHRAMWQRWQAMRPDLDRGGRVISLQLGGGCSVTAVERGVPRDTSMGFSPLEGLVMATRCGDLDPAVPLYLQRVAGMSLPEVERLLNEESGLQGLSGHSADMRTLLDSGRPAAQFAVDLYCYRIRKYLGAYLAVLGGVDGVLFGGGTGEHSPAVRSGILAGLEGLGLELDSAANDAAVASEALISPPRQRPQIWVLPVDEAAIMARDALAAITIG